MADHPRTHAPTHWRGKPPARGLHTPATAAAYLALAGHLERLAERAELCDMPDPVEVYDAGSNAFGICPGCGAWPTEAHDLLEGEDCPEDPDEPGTGLVYFGRFNVDEFPAIARLTSITLEARVVPDDPSWTGADGAAAQATAYARKLRDRADTLRRDVPERLRPARSTDARGPDPVDGLTGPVEADVLPRIGRGTGGVA